MYWHELTRLDLEVIPLAFVRNTAKRVLKMSDFFVKNTNCNVFIIQIGTNDITSTFVKEGIFNTLAYKIISKLKIKEKIIKEFYKINQNKIKKILLKKI